MFDYPPSRHPGQGSTSRLSGALGMVREHYDLTRGGAAGAGGVGAGGVGGAGARGYGQPGKKRAAQIDYSIYGDDYPAMAGGSAGYGRKDKDKDPSQRHPNQYTKKRLQGAAAAGGLGGAYGGASPSGALGGVISAQSANVAAGVYSNAVPHPMGMTAVESVKEKRRGQEAAGGGAAALGSTSAQGSRASSVAPGAGVPLAYQGIASQSEYELATLGGAQRAAAKRKVEDVAGASKRRKKGLVCLLVSWSVQLPFARCRANGAALRSSRTRTRG